MVSCRVHRVLCVCVRVCEQVCLCVRNMVAAAAAAAAAASGHDGVLCGAKHPFSGLCAH